MPTPLQTAAERALDKQAAEAREAEAAAQEAIEGKTDVVTLENEIAELREKEQRAVEAAVAAGARHVYTVGSPALRLSQKREQLERRLARLVNFELPARAAHEAKRQAAAARARRERAQKDARKLDRAEQDALNAAVTSAVSFFAAFANLADAARGREALYAQLETDGGLAGLDENERKDFARSFAASLEPFPVSVSVFFAALVEAIAEPHARSAEYEQGAPDVYRLAHMLPDVDLGRALARVYLTHTAARTGFTGPKLESAAA